MFLTPPRRRAGNRVPAARKGHAARARKIAVAAAASRTVEAGKAARADAVGSRVQEAKSKRAVRATAPARVHDPARHAAPRKDRAARAQVSRVRASVRAKDPTDSVQTTKVADAADVGRQLDAWSSCCASL